MKIKAKNCFHSSKSCIGNPVTDNDDVVVGKITDVTKDYIYAEVNLTEADVLAVPTSFSIEIVKG